MKKNTKKFSNYKQKVISYLQSEWLDKPLEEILFGKINWDDPLAGNVTPEQKNGSEQMDIIDNLIAKNCYKQSPVPNTSVLIFKHLQKNNLVN
jgi:hypothetical protein